jgi:methionyl-tRNA synthetase
MAKDILWFHAVIWPCMLHALGEQPPETVYAHAYWIAEGRKMSKSLGNFIEIDQLRAYADRYSLDAVRWFLTTQGPLGATDADFAHAGSSRSTTRARQRHRQRDEPGGNMFAKYFDGSCAPIRDEARPGAG